MYFQEYLEVCPAYGWVGAPEFSTRIVGLANGRERRNGNWDQPRHKYAASFQNIGHEDYIKILTMFMACKGRLHAFRMRDELNYRAVDQQFGVGTGSLETYQLQTVFTVDGFPYGRYVYAIRTITQIRVNGVPTGSYTADLDRGTVSMSATLGGVLEWDGEFDIWVRFDNDDLPFSLDSRNSELGEIVNGSVNLIEVPPPPEGS